MLQKKFEAPYKPEIASASDVASGLPLEEPDFASSPPAGESTFPHGTFDAFGAFCALFTAGEER